MATTRSTVRLRCNFIYIATRSLYNMRAEDVAINDVSSNGVSTDLNASSRWKDRLLRTAGWDVRRIAFFEWTGSSPSNLRGSTAAETILSPEEQEKILKLRLPSELVMTADERAQSVLQQGRPAGAGPSENHGADDGGRPTAERTEISEEQVGTPEELMGGSPQEPKVAESAGAAEAKSHEEKLQEAAAKIDVAALD